MAEGAGAAVEKAAKDPVQAAVAVADAWIRHPRGAHPGCAGEEVAAAVVGEAGPTTRTAEAHSTNCLLTIVLLGGPSADSPITR